MARRTRIISAAVAMLTALGGTAALARPAAAVSSTHFVSLVEGRVFDSRSDGGLLTAGEERRIDLTPVLGATITGVALRLTAFDAVTYGTISVHPCGAYDPAAPVDAAADLNDVTANVVYVPLQNRAFCLTSTVGTNLVIDLLGMVDPAVAGAAYVAVADTPIFTGTVPAGQTVTVPVDVPGVPANLQAASLWVDAGAAGTAQVFLGACDLDRPASAAVTVVNGGSVDHESAYSTVNAKQLCLSVEGVDADVTVTMTGYWATGATATADGPPRRQFDSRRGPGLVAVTPTRLFDTRSSRPVAGGSVHRFDLTGTVPATATAIVMNVTVTAPLSAGFVTVYPCDLPQPTVSNLNYVAGQTVPNQVVVGLSGGLEMCFFSHATTDLVADLSGYFDLDAGDGLVPGTPARLFDTRDGGAPVATGGVYVVDLTGKVPADATAAVMNVTVTEPVASGFVTVYPCDATRPTASNLNYVARQTVPNLVTVALPADKRVCLYAHTATHLLADLAASFAPSSKLGFYAIDPVRSFDTRADNRPVPGGAAFPFSFGPGPLDGPDEVAAVVLNITAADASAAGFVTAYACDAARPTASNVNYVAGDVVPNLALVATGAGDDLCFYAHATTHLVVDQAGYFSEARRLVRHDTR